ncbi:hypothetical protein M4A92_14715 [Caldibacillus thermoamylovorans]|uniref:hypothetical protein n=1 Tax=Caldibacillus thermoamylovorans TaxID=35841 RepID=UPI00203BEB99|nr:hypothetical protein [Caldibacillus thermoamylovorans]MCM3799851.1 hypothetical protein [Caldibacillus thermoamylovorans]
MLPEIDMAYSFFTQLYGLNLLVVFFWLETHFFGDETLSRRLFEPGNSFFWRRDPFSSSFFGWKLTFLATKPVLIIIMAGNYHFLATKIKKTQASKHSSSTCP